jgi:hypothetical protein
MEADRSFETVVTNGKIPRRYKHMKFNIKFTDVSEEFDASDFRAI